MERKQSETDIQNKIIMGKKKVAQGVRGGRNGDCGIKKENGSEGGDWAKDRSTLDI